MSKIKLQEVEELVDNYIDILSENAYQDFFREKLKKWGVKSPSQLDDEKKKKFFAEVKKEWKNKKKK